MSFLEVFNFNFIIMIIIALVVSCIGFYKYVYFISLGSIVRCPNYLSEVVFWTGVFVSGVDTLNSVWQWIGAIIGYVCIVYIMFGGARRLEIRQNRNYGSDKEYQEYVKRTPILIPLVPLYSVEKHKWLVG